MNPPSNTASIDRLERILPLLIGDEGWSQVGNEVKNQLSALKQQDEADLIIAKLLVLLMPYPDATGYILTESNPLRLELKEIVLRTLELQISSEEIDHASNLALQIVTPISDQNEPQRLATVNKKTMEGRTVKRQNIKLDYQKLIKLTAIAIPGTLGLVTTSTKLALVTAILSLITIFSLELIEGQEVKFSEDESSVFLGLVLAIEKNLINKAKDDKKQEKSASLKSIVKFTNQQRTIVGLTPLTTPQITRILYRLKKLKCVEEINKASSTWLLIEDYKIEA